MFQAGSAELFAMPEDDLTAVTIDAFTSEVDNGLSQCGNDWDMFVVDMNNVSQVDVRGVQAIIKYYKHSRDLDKQFMLINVDEDLLRFLQLFRLHTKFPIGLNKTSAQLEAARQKAGK
ncbi:MAG: STAS domain-containing protein [Lentisphaeraceae bacterium]|nr:STAS domain-containing protein [Lentisphaeraceae bacterium]